jgi:hypothetical protein
MATLTATALACSLPASSLLFLIFNASHRPRRIVSIDRFLLETVGRLLIHWHVNAGHGERACTHCRSRYNLILGHISRQHLIGKPRSDRPLDCARPEEGILLLNSYPACLLNAVDHTNKCLLIGRHSLFRLRIRALECSLPAARMDYGNTLVATNARNPSPARTQRQTQGSAE